MTALIRAEVLKLRTRSTVWLLLTTLGLAALTVVTNTPKTNRAEASLNDPHLLAGLVGIGFGVPEVLIVLLGGLAFTQEFRYGTVTSTYLAEPRRTRVLVAKWLTMAITSIALTLATLAVSVTVGCALISSRHGNVTVAFAFWQTVAVALLVMAAYAVVGVAIGALLRNQIVAVVAVLIWMLAVEQIVIPAYPTIGRWMPGGATDALLRFGPVLHLDQNLLPTPVAGLVLLGYTSAAITLALALTPRRDLL